MVRPRKGNHSAGLIIRFERSGGRGFDKGPLSRAPPPALPTAPVAIDYAYSARKSAWAFDLNTLTRTVEACPSVPRVLGQLQFSH